MAGFATQISGSRRDKDLAGPGTGARDSGRTVKTDKKTPVLNAPVEAYPVHDAPVAGKAMRKAGRIMMRMPWGLNARHLYLGFFSVISIALCAFSMVIYSQHTRVQNLNAYTIRQYEVIRQSRGILSDVLNMETGVRGYVMSGQTKFLEPYTTASARLRDEIFNLRNAMYYEPTSFAETSNWLDQIEVIQDLLARQVTYVQRYGKGTISPSELEEEKSDMDRLRQTLETANGRRLKDLQAQVADVNDERNNFDYILIIGTVLGIGILLIGTVVIIRLEIENEIFEDESQKAESRFKAVMDGVNDGLYELNFVNDTMYMSREFKAMLGFGEDEIENSAQASIALIHPDDRDASLEVRRQYLTKQTPVYNNVFRMRHKDGTWRWVMSRGVGTWDKFGAIRSIIGTHTDITEQKNREEELRQLHADMEAFTYITSHDMRSPLVNLKGFSYELSMAVNDVNALLEPKREQLGEDTWQKLDHVLKHDVPEALGFIGNAVDRMDTLTTAILDLSRIGKYVYREEVVSSQTVMDKVLGAQSYELGNKKVEVTVAPLPDLITDPVALEQVFSNLLDNAVKYLRSDVPGRIQVECQETARDYIFSVADNGRGIDAQDAERVFQIFRRARNTGEVRGQGLGMAFVKATLRKLSGTIWFESTVNEGTTFFVSLPRKIPGALAASTAPSTGLSSGPATGLAGHAPAQKEAGA